MKKKQKFFSILKNKEKQSNFTELQFKCLKYYLIVKYLRKKLTLYKSPKSESEINLNNKNHEFWLSLSYHFTKKEFIFDDFKFLEDLENKYYEKYINREDEKIKEAKKNIFYKELLDVKIKEFEHNKYRFKIKHDYIIDNLKDAFDKVENKMKKNIYTYIYEPEFNNKMYFPNNIKRKYKKITVEEKFQINLYYTAIFMFVGGNQYSLHYYTDYLNFLNKGFKVEIFGSSLNSFLPYFGSISSIDEPTGRIADYEEILKILIDNKELKWRDEIVFKKDEIVKITVNPPSSLELHKYLIDLLEQLFLKRKTEIFLDLPKSTVVNDITYNQKLIKYEKSRKETTKVYYIGETYYLNQPWFNFYLSNF